MLQLFTHLHVKNTNTVSRDNQLIYIMSALNLHKFKKVDGLECCYKDIHVLCEIEGGAKINMRHTLQSYLIP